MAAQMCSRSAPVDPRETCAIMEREARKVREKQYTSNRKEEVCPSIVIDEINNKYNKGTLRNQMQFKQQRPQSDVGGAVGGVTPGGTPARIG